jgi:hypothetical protein
MAPKLTTAMDLDDPTDSSLQKEESEPPKLTLFDAIILKGKSTPASVDDLSTGVPLRAEGYLWIEEPEKMCRKFSIHLFTFRVHFHLQNSHITQSTSPMDRTVWFHSSSSPMNATTSAQSLSGF